MNHNLYSYGCSFSYPFWIEENECYTNIVSLKLGLNNISRAHPGLCHNETFDRLLTDIDLFTEKDIIIYQFTAGEREGYMVENNFYFSSAGILDTLEETVQQMDKWGGGRHTHPFSDEKLLTLMEYVPKWGIDTILYKFNRVNKVLKYLQATKNINYIYLFLDDYFDPILDKEKTVFFNQPDGTLTPSIMNWAWMSKLTLSDSRTDVHPEDKHPNHLGHKVIAENIINKIKGIV